MNSVQLVGRLATDVDMKEVTGGSKVCSFILAVDRNAEEADFALPPPEFSAASHSPTASAESWQWQPRSHFFIDR